MSTAPIVLIAGTTDEAQQYCRETGLQPRDVIYASNPATLHGLRRPAVVRVGSWQQRPDLAGIEAALAARSV
ncbi:hypothetical protein [Streptomyces sp. KR2]|uniref:hypothetical protein n=1 Tax=Streptomyces sp. KR2 TaxID=1514824 RepID=UPI003F811F95